VLWWRLSVLLVMMSVSCLTIGALNKHATLQIPATTTFITPPNPIHTPQSPQPQGWAATTLPAPGAPPPTTGMDPLLDAILSHVPAPTVDPAAAFQMCVAMIEKDPYVGRLATGRVFSGKVKVGDRIRVIQHPAGGGGAGRGGDGSATPVTIDDLKVTKIEKRVGMTKVQLAEALAGDIVQLAGTGDAAGIADTIAAPSVAVGLDPGPIDPPTLRCACLGSLLWALLGVRLGVDWCAKRSSTAASRPSLTPHPLTHSPNRTRRNPNPAAWCLQPTTRPWQARAGAR